MGALSVGEKIMKGLILLFLSYLSHARRESQMCKTYFSNYYQLWRAVEIYSDKQECRCDQTIFFFLIGKVFLATCNSASVKFNEFVLDTPGTALRNRHTDVIHKSAEKGFWNDQTTRSDICASVSQISAKMLRDLWLEFLIGRTSLWYSYFEKE